MNTGAVTRSAIPTLTETYMKPSKPKGKKTKKGRKKT